MLKRYEVFTTSIEKHMHRSAHVSHLRQLHYTPYPVTNGQCVRSPDWASASKTSRATSDILPGKFIVNANKPSMPSTMIHLLLLSR